MGKKSVRESSPLEAIAEDVDRAVGALDTDLITLLIMKLQSYTETDT